MVQGCIHVRLNNSTALAQRKTLLTTTIYVAQIIAKAFSLRGVMIEAEYLPFKRKRRD